MTRMFFALFLQSGEKRILSHTNWKGIIKHLPVLLGELWDSSEGLPDLLTQYPHLHDGQVARLS